MAEPQVNSQDQNPTLPLGPMGEQEATQKIDQWLSSQEPESPDDPAPQEATEQATPAPQEAPAATEADDEPTESAKGEDAEAEKADADSKTEQAEPEEVEVADTIEGLADQLGVETNDLKDHLKVTVKIDGQTKSVSLAEAAAGFQLESKYRQNMQALSEEKKAFETERQTFQQTQQQNLQLVQHLMQQAEQAVLGAERAIDPNLQDEDPQQYMLLKEQARERRDQYQALYGSYYQLQQQQEAEQHGFRDNYVTEQANKLAELIPEWGSDPGKGQTELTELRNWASDKYGFSHEEAMGMLDARTIQAFNDLKRLTDLEGKVPAVKKKLKAVPKTVKPGAGRDASDHKTDKLRATLKRARKTQKDGDWAEALLQSGIVD